MLGTGPDRSVRLYERRIAAEVALISHVRHEMALALEEANVDPTMAADACLVTSELCTNAVHATTPNDDVTVRVGTLGDDLVIEVDDGGAGFRLGKELRLPNNSEEHGRGLGIVCLVATETTVRRRRRRTVVRALLRRNEAVELAGDLEESSHRV